MWIRSCSFPWYLSVLFLFLSPLSSGELGLINKCLSGEGKAEADVNDMLKRSSFYPDMVSGSPSCLIDAATTDAENAREICSNGPRSSTHRSYSDLLQDYLKECDDLVHYRVLMQDAGSDWAGVGCVVSVEGEKMWKYPNADLHLTNISEEFSKVEGFSCNTDRNLKELLVRRRMCFETKYLIMNKDPITGTEDRKCDVTMLKLASDTYVRNRIISCAVRYMNSPTPNPDAAINKCRCLERAPYGRIVKNCTSKEGELEQCQDLAELTTLEKSHLSYMGLCLRKDASNLFDSEQGSKQSCMRSADDDKSIDRVRDFLLHCDNTTLNTYFRATDGCVYRTNGSSGDDDTKWTKPQSTKITKDYEDSEETESAVLIEIPGVFECPDRDLSPTDPANQRRVNQNRQLLNIWRTTCNVVVDLLSSDSEKSCRQLHVLRQITPGLLVPPNTSTAPSNVEAHTKNFLDCVKGQMDAWDSDPTEAFTICMDKEFKQE